MKRTTIIIILLRLSHLVWSQIKIDTSRSTNYLVENILLGNGILVGNVKYEGPGHGIGLFDDEGYNVHLEKGLILTTGSAFFSSGPNRVPDKGWVSATTGDEDLDQITQGGTYDAAVLEFDFVTSSEYLSFNYVFASEEYPEYVGSKYNDVFAFFVDGPGLNHVNLAKLPNSDVPITINNVNHKRNKKYFNDNTFENTTHPFLWDHRKKKPIVNKKYGKKVDPAPYNVQYDGFTQVMEARCKVIPNQIYHIKIAIADVSDAILDSGVFLEAGSFRSFGEELVALEDPFQDGASESFDIQASAKKEIEVRERNGATASSISYSRPSDKEQILSIEFEFDSFDIPDSAFAWLGHVYDFIQHNPQTSVKVIGHTDSIGSIDYNLKLSEKRSLAVASYLHKMGLQESLIHIRYQGEAQPIYSNNTSMGRTRNRRVEFIFNYQGEEQTHNIWPSSMANQP